MDPELAALATTAASALVKSMATEGWKKIAAGIKALWQRVHPQRADAVHDELIEARQELLAARQAGDELAEQNLINEWDNRLHRLLAAAPEIAATLQTMVDEMARPALTVEQPTVAMRATAKDRSQVYQAGRDQHIRHR